MIDFKKLRLDENLKQNELAEMLSIKASYLTFFETGRRGVPKSVYTKLMEIFGIEKLAKYITDDLKNKVVPFYKKESTLFINDFTFLLEGRPVYKINIPLMNDCDVAIESNDDCMHPYITSSDIILLKFMSTKQPIFGNVYFIITSHLKSLRYVKKGVGIETLLLVAENKHYEDIAIHKNDIQFIYQFAGRIGK